MYINLFICCFNKSRYYYFNTILKLFCISDAKLKTLQTFLSKIDYEEKSFKISQSSGYINVTDLIVPVKERNKKDFSEYYVCILYHDQHVYMTDYIKAMDNKFVFNGTNICFNNIDSDFEIKIEFFLLKLKKSIRNYSHESRYNLKNVSIKFYSYRDIYILFSVQMLQTINIIAFDLKYSIHNFNIKTILLYNIQCKIFLMTFCKSSKSENLIF